MPHFDYVMLPNGHKQKITSPEDVEKVLAEWAPYIEENWLTPQRKMFDPESKVKYMLEGLANIILRPNMEGQLTEYQKMKTQKYEIPFSSFGSMFNDELYSRRSHIDNGEEEERIKTMMDELAKAYDDALAAKNPHAPPKKKKKFPPTRRQKIEAVRSADGIQAFEFVTVDTGNNFCFQGKEYHIPAEAAPQYSGKATRGGDVLYDMDQV